MYIPGEERHIHIPREEEAEVEEDIMDLLHNTGTCL
jgi:hypothetical protein